MFTSPIESLTEAFDALVAQDPHDLNDGQLLVGTEALLRERRRLDGVIARRLQAMDARDVTTHECARSTRAWLIEEQSLSRPEANARMRVARSYLSRPTVVDALLAGDIGHDHATLIVTFLASLPLPEQRDEAAKLLLDAATDTDPTTMTAGLRELTDRLNLNETAQTRAVRRREGRYLSLIDTFNGMVRLDGMLDGPDGAIVKAAIAALAQPGGGVDERTVTQRNADALVELAHLAITRGQLPDTAGEPTQLHVITDLDDLLRRMQPGQTCRSTLNHIPITPDTARMHACDAGIIPVLMRGDSEILDLGRTTRAWTRAQRKAAKLRAGGHCEAPLCQTTLDRCDLHHDHHWAHGGRSDLNNATSP